MGGIPICIHKVVVSSAAGSPHCFCPALASVLLVPLAPSAGARAGRAGAWWSAGRSRSRPDRTASGATGRRHNYDARAADGLADLRIQSSSRQQPAGLPAARAADRAAGGPAWRARPETRGVQTRRQLHTSRSRPPRVGRLTESRRYGGERSQETDGRRARRTGYAHQKVEDDREGAR